MVSYKEVAETNREGQQADAAVQFGNSPRTVTRGWNSQTRLPESSQGVSISELMLKSASGRVIVGLHWLRGSILETRKAWLVRMFCVLFGPDYEIQNWGFWRYDRSYKWPCGATIHYHSTQAGSDETLGRISLELSGKVLDSLDPWVIGMLCCNLDRHGFQPTRLDLYLDDPNRSIIPSDLYKTVCERGRPGQKPIRADFSGFRIIDDRSRLKKNVGLIHDEVTFGLRGNLGSGKYLRVYDKNLESKGQNKAIRWELELSDHKARGVFHRIVNAFSQHSDIDEIASAIGQTIGGCIDFLHRTDRAGDKNLNRLKRYRFWQAFIDNVGRVKIAAKKIVRTIEKSENWIDRQVMAILQMIRKAKGDEAFLSRLIGGIMSDDRLRPHHQKVIAEYHYQQGKRPENCSWQQRGFVRPD